MRPINLARFRTFRATQRVMLALSVSLIIAAAALQVVFGQTAGDFGMTCTGDAFTGVTFSCLYPDGYVVAKAVQAFAPGAFAAGLVGVLLALALHGIGQSLNAVVASDTTPAEVPQEETIPNDLYRRPSR